MKRIKRIAIFCFSVSFLVLHSCSDKPSQNKNDVSEKYSETEKASLLADMKDVISDFSNENSVRDLNDAKSQLQRLGYAWDKCYGRLIEAKSDSIVWNMKDSAINVLANYQRRMFPKYRNAFTIETDKKLWIEDCSAFISGENNEILNLIGLTFARNRTKQESYDTLRDVLKDYRFKKLTFRIFKSSSDTTLFEIKSNEDSGYVPMIE